MSAGGGVSAPGGVSARGVPALGVGCLLRGCGIPACTEADTPLRVDKQTPVKT